MQVASINTSGHKCAPGPGSELTRPEQPDLLLAVPGASCTPALRAHSLFLPGAASCCIACYLGPRHAAAWRPTC